MIESKIQRDYSPILPRMNKKWTRFLKNVHGLNGLECTKKCTTITKMYKIIQNVQKCEEWNILNKQLYIICRYIFFGLFFFCSEIQIWYQKWKRFTWRHHKKIKMFPIFHFDQKNKIWAPGGTSNSKLRLSRSRSPTSKWEI